MSQRSCLYTVWKVSDSLQRSRNADEAVTFCPFLEYSVHTLPSSCPAPRPSCSGPVSCTSEQEQTQQLHDAHMWQFSVHSFIPTVSDSLSITLRLMASSVMSPMATLLPIHSSAAAPVSDECCGCWWLISSSPWHRHVNPLLCQLKLSKHRELKIKTQ